MMLQLRWLGALFLMACAAPSPRTPSDDAARRAERELLAAEEEWVRAVLKRDAAAFRRLLAPDFVYTDERGVFSRDSLIAEVTAGTDTVDWAANDSMVVHLYGNTGVVTGILSMRGRGASGPFTHRYRFTDTWVRQNGRWVVVAAQDYDMPSR